MGLAAWLVVPEGDRLVLGVCLAAPQSVDRGLEQVDALAVHPDGFACLNSLSARIMPTWGPRLWLLVDDVRGLR